MMTILYFVAAIVLFYLLFTLFLTYLVQQVPRNPVHDPPNWGQVLDTRIPSLEDGAFLEVWRIGFCSWMGTQPGPNGFPGQVFWPMGIYNHHSQCPGSR